MSTYDLYKNKAYSLRIPNEMQEKVKTIAKKENRKISQQYELIIKRFLDEYEQTNGKIKIEEKGQAANNQEINITNGSNNIIIGNNNNGTINM